MGLFDEIISSYKPLGDEFLNKLCQTKSLECYMGHYWLSPAGELFEIDHNNAFDLEITANKETPWEGFNWIPNGNHKKLHPVYETVELTIYPAQWKGDWEDWPEATLHLLYGKVQGYTIKSKGERVTWQSPESLSSTKKKSTRKNNLSSLDSPWDYNSIAPSSTLSLKR